MSGVSSAAVQRLRKDAARLAKDPVPFILATPSHSNILEWHYVVRGPPDSVYTDGIYHGKLVFPREYPFKPPSIYMLTPNGRFQTNTRLCLSISDFHPDTWNPAWSVGTILTGLLSFMLETTPTLGSIETSNYEKRQCAFASGEYNLKNKTFRELFPELCKEIQREIDERVQRNKQATTVKLSKICDKNAKNEPTSAPDSGTELIQHIENDQQIDPALDNSTETGGTLAGTALWNSSAISNLLVFLGVVAFLFVAKCVLQSVE